MQDELGGRITVEFATLRPKTCRYLTDNKDKNKTAKNTTKCDIKRKLKFDNYKHCLEVTQVENKQDKLIFYENSKQTKASTNLI